MGRQELFSGAISLLVVLFSVLAALVVLFSVGNYP